MKIPLDQEEEAKFAMAPMIDMVFLLLIFFMCASHISVSQNVPLEIPTATRAVVPEERPDRFIVNITADGSLFAGNAPLETLAALKSTVESEKAANPDLRIYLRADQQTEHRHVRKVMNVMGELGIDDFIFGAFIPAE